MAQVNQHTHTQERGQDVMAQFPSPHGVTAPDFSPSALSLPVATVR
jgi:hypothetical protein